ncbi:MAG: family 16 glycoside hydrolase [Roseimicrobium sp.]
MKVALLAALILTVGISPHAFAGDVPLLAIPGKVVYESKLDTAPSSPWKAAKGAWELKDGVWRGSEKPEDKHGAVTRMTTKLQDFVIEYELKFEGAKSTSLSINALKDHMARISITPKSVIVQRDDNDHEGPDKAVVFARIAADFQPGTWHKVRLEMVGDTLVGKVDDLVAWGSNDLFKQDRVNPGFTVGGQSVDFRNLTIREATLNPEWEKTKATLPAPGSQMTAAPARKGPGKAKKAE